MRESDHPWFSYSWSGFTTRCPVCGKDIYGVEHHKRALDGSTNHNAHWREGTCENCGFHIDERRDA